MGILEAVAGDIEEAWPGIKEYLGKRGYRDDKLTNKYLGETIEFYKESHIHFRRLGLRDLVARTINADWNMANPGHQKRVWDYIADVAGVEDSTKSRWKSGLIDPSPGDLFRFVQESRNPPIDLPPIDRQAARRFAIRRTLAYLWARPWPIVPPGVEVHRILRQCWKDIRKHKYFIKSSSHNMNQSCLDLIERLHGPQFPFDLSMHGSIKRQMYTSPWYDDPLLYPWAIFKYTTYVEFPDPNRQVWEEGEPEFGMWWRNGNG